MVGMPHSAVALAQLEVITDMTIGWFSLMMVGAPIFATLLVCYFFLLRFFCKPEITTICGGREFLLGEREKLGKMSSAERIPWEILHRDRRAGGNHYDRCSGHLLPDLRAVSLGITRTHSFRAHPYTVDSPAQDCWLSGSCPRRPDIHRPTPGIRLIETRLRRHGHPLTPAFPAGIS